MIRASGWRRRAEQGILRVIRGLFHNGLDGAKQTDLLRNQTGRSVGEAAISGTGWPFIVGRFLPEMRLTLDELDLEALIRT